MTTINTIEDLARILQDQPTWAEALRALLLTDRPLNAKEPPDDPLDDPKKHPDTYHGAVLLSDQIEFYIKDFAPPLLQNPDDTGISKDELEKCLDAASYKLRLGNEAHVGGEWVRISEEKPLVIPRHQVAVVKTHEVINVPRFLIARWNLRVKWVYEGLLWTGGPQVDPGWQGHLYCPIYNLAEREIVIPHKEPVFTMDFTRTTPVHDTMSTYGFIAKPHEHARAKTLQAHDVNRLRSAPFESLKLLETLDDRIEALNSRITNFSSLTFLVLAVVIAAIGVLASLASGGSAALKEELKGDSGVFVLTIIALVFGLSGLIVGSIAMVSKLVKPPRNKIGLAIFAFLGAAIFGSGAGYLGMLLTSGPLDGPTFSKILQWAVTWVFVLTGFLMLGIVWHRGTSPDP